MLTRAWSAILGAAASHRRREPVIVAKEHVFGASTDVAIGIATDAVFGPVITFGASGYDTRHRCRGAPAAAQPASRDRHASRLGAIGGPRARAMPTRSSRPSALSRHLLVQLSALACAVPWVRTLTLDPVRVGARPSRDRRRPCHDRSHRAGVRRDPMATWRSTRIRWSSPPMSRSPTARDCTSAPFVRRMPSSSAHSSPDCRRRRATSASSTSCTS